MELLSLIAADIPNTPVNLALDVLPRLPLSRAADVHAEREPVSKPSLKMRSPGARGVEDAVGVWKMVGVKEAGTGVGISVLVNV